MQNTVLERKKSNSFNQYNSQLDFKSKSIDSD